MTLATKRAPFPFTEAAPHAVRDLQPHRELEALALDRAYRADGFRVAHRLTARGKEIDLTRVVQAFGLLLPRRRDAADAGCDVVRARTRRPIPLARCDAEARTRGTRSAPDTLDRSAERLRRRGRCWGRTPACPRLDNCPRASTRIRRESRARCGTCREPGALSVKSLALGLSRPPTGRGAREPTEIRDLARIITSVDESPL